MHDEMRAKSRLLSIVSAVYQRRQTIRGIAPARHCYTFRVFDECREG
jgi:hypothetical protein